MDRKSAKKEENNLMSPGRLVTGPTIKYWLVIVVLMLVFTALTGGFTAYTEYAVLYFEEISEGEYLQVPHPDYPIGVTRHFRFPWEDGYTRYYVLPPFSTDSGTYYLPSGEFAINGTIVIKK